MALDDLRPARGRPTAPAGDRRHATGHRRCRPLVLRPGHQARFTRRSHDRACPLPGAPEPQLAGDLCVRRRLIRCDRLTGDSGRGRSTVGHRPGSRIQRHWNRGRVRAAHTRPRERRGPPARYNDRGRRSPLSGHSDCRVHGRGHRRIALPRPGRPTSHRGLHRRSGRHHGGGRERPPPQRPWQPGDWVGGHGHRPPLVRLAIGPPVGC